MWIAPAAHNLPPLRRGGRGGVGGHQLSNLRNRAKTALNHLARFREGEAPSEPIPVPARTEPRPPKIKQTRLGFAVRASSGRRRDGPGPTGGAGRRRGGHVALAVVGEDRGRDGGGAAVVEVGVTLRRPQSGAVRISRAPVLPWTIPSPRLPMSWRRKSEKGWNTTLFRAAVGLGPLRNVGTWQKAQPIAAKIWSPPLPPGESAGSAGAPGRP